MAATAPIAPAETKSNSLNDPKVIAEKIKTLFPDAVESVTDQAIVVKGNQLVDVARYLHDTTELGFDYLHNVTSVDWPDHFEVVYNVSNLSRGGAPITLKVNAPREDPSVPSLVPVYRGADFQEREVYDMMGIRFTGHPNLRRILMWDGFEGYPLRKDYKEPYYEDERKPFGTRWDQGHHVIAEDRNPWHDNVKYPTNFDAVTFKPPQDKVRTVGIEEATATRLKTEKLVLNIGPQHPSTHGVLRLRTTLDGETVVAVEPVLGYLHRNHEKIGERNTYLQNIPFTDRLDYITSMANNLAYVVAVEKLMAAKVPERAEYIRVIMAEMTRWMNHIAALGFIYNDLGAFFTPLLYGLEERELILDLFEAASGSRMMCNYMRFGGIARDLPEGWLDKCNYLVNERMPRRTDEMEAYLVKNELFTARAKNIGILPREQAINYSAAGPMLRASGVKYDLRRAQPYSIYDRFEFDIPVGTVGDMHDRFTVRIAEMRESIKILGQALKQIPAGEILTGKKNYQVRVPKGDVYGAAENPKGELGFYLASDGTPNPYRYHVRSPAFINLGALNEMACGYKVADLIVILGSIDITMGEVDR
jgi:NADH-quinone oxidoreductase subunit C/D